MSQHTGESKCNTGIFITCAFCLEGKEIDEDIIEWRAGLDGPAAVGPAAVLLREAGADDDSPGTITVHPTPAICQ